MKMQNATLFSNFITRIFLLVLISSISSVSKAQMTIGGVYFGDLPKHLFVFTDANADANWQGATKGFVGDVAVDGISAKLRTSGGVPFAGTIYTNNTTLGAWQNILNQNASQASGVYSQNFRISALETDLEYAFSQINMLPATNNYSSVSSSSLNGMDAENGVSETFVINITSGLQVSSKINIKGDAGDIFILRWDTDADFSNGYNGQVKFQSGGAIVPLGSLSASNFIHVAGDIGSSGGGSNPSAPYPQGPRNGEGTGDLINGGSDFKGGGFFTGYWLTTGKPTIFPGNNMQPYGETSSLSNAIFVGGWYSKTTKFSMTSGTSGIYISPKQTELFYGTRTSLQQTGPVNGNSTINNANKPASILNLKNAKNSNAFIQNSAGLKISGVYPNPFIANLNVMVQSERSMPVTINIYDNSGKLVLSQKNTVQEGNNIIKFDNLNSLSRGAYFIKISSPDGFTSGHIVK